MPCAWEGPEDLPENLMFGALEESMQRPGPPGSTRIAVAAGLDDDLVLSGRTDELIDRFPGGAAPVDVKRSGSVLPNPFEGAALLGPLVPDDAVADDPTAGHQALKDALGAQPMAQSTVLGLADIGINFVHERFRQADPAGGPDRSRFAMFWVMDRVLLENPPPYAGALGRGTLLLGPDIDALIAAHWRGTGLDEDAVYRAFSRPAAGMRDAWALRTGHGTAMLDLMAGGGSETLLGIELPSVSLTDTSGLAVMSLLPQALHAMMMLSPAGSAVVVNFSLAFTGGPMDGSHPLARGLGEVLALWRAAGRNVTLTLPSGNHLQDRVHARLRSGQSVDWVICPDDRTISVCEILGAKGLVVTPPGCDPCKVRAPGRNKQYRLMKDGQEIARLAQGDDRPGVLRLMLFPTAGGGGPLSPAGIWRLEVSGAADASLWIQRDDTLSGFRPNGRQSRFRDGAYRKFANTGRLKKSASDAGPVARDGTLSVLATAPGITLAEGAERSHGGRETVPYRLSGLAPGANEGNAQATLAEESRSKGGPLAAAARGAGTLRLAGTSAASAIQARREAMQMSGKKAPPDLLPRAPKEW